MRALCVISGGMDSTLCAYIAKNLGYEIVGLHFDYNQRTMNREKEAFLATCKSLEIKEQVILDTSFIATIGANSLTDLSMQIPKNSLENGEIPPTYVPFRNGIFLSIAGALAESKKCNVIYIGVVEEDSSGYPDCSEEFINSIQKSINLGTSPNFKVEIKTPLVHLSKADIVKKGLELNMKFEETWSCYEREDKACGHCDSCLLRLRGFEKAGEKDRIEYL